ncbi:cyclin-like protein [Cladorrhinum sp. PSN332]|nr:cyclin-like protein [Cladorrhinum sp. PSN332]
MDAKPQRPLRSFAAAPGIENNPSKPTHQRHKSVGNLKSNMAVTGSLNAPPKRTAFGDVSNTSRTLAVEGVGKDSIHGRGKAPVVATAVMRDTRIPAEDKQDKENVLRLTTAAAKASLNGGVKNQVPTSSTNTGHQAAKPTVRANTQAQQQQQRSSGALAQPPIKAAVVKKTTVVYNDKTARDTGVRTETGSAVDDLLALVDKQIKNPRQSKTQSALMTEQQQAARQPQTKFALKTDKLIEISDDEGDVDDDETEAAYEDAVEQLTRNAAFQIRNEPVDDEQDFKRLVDIENNAVLLAASRFEPSRYTKALPAPPVTSEPEEYSDEDDEQELYDEQGYTTAHSYRSHGDNTTGGPTSIVAPNIDRSVEKELELAKSYVLQNQTEDEVEEEAWDVSMVAEYGDEIFGYMRHLEDTMIPDSHYMEIQTEIQWSMRSVLMDWLVQVHHRFCLLPETLFLTVNYIDRFLSVKIVSLGKLQLVGATALFLAAKYEEINCPSVQEIVYMVDSGYTVDEILKAERFMLGMLQFELGWPGPMSFLRRISKADDYELETRTLAKYFLEVTIMDERFVSSPPSYIAAGAHCISRMFLEKGDWTLAHVHYSGYTLSQLKPLINMMYECCRDARKHHSAVFDKYSSPKYKNASTFIENKILNGMTLARLYAGMVADQTSSSISDNEYVRAPLVTIEG